MTNAAFGRLVRCWHAQATQLATLVETSEGEPGWDDAVAAFVEAGERLRAREMRVAARRASAAAAPDRVRCARALRGAATRAARRAVAPRRSAADERARAGA